MRIDVSFVIPSFNGRRHLERALSQLFEAAPEAEVIVVDVGSTDGSAELVEARFPQAKLLRERNFGWGHATNRGAERSTRPIVAFMNSDVFVERPALEAMVARLVADPELGAVAPMLRFPDGRRQPLWGLLEPVLYPPRARMADGAVEVPQISGAFLMAQRSMLERIGGLDENHFFYNEEYDWCRRVRLAGYRLELLRDQWVTHVGGGSTPRKPEFVLEQMRGFLYFLGKHFPGAPEETIRALMELHGRAASRLDPRPAHRAMWAKLATLTASRSYLSSPFPLSGRGVPTIPTIAEAAKSWLHLEEEAPPKSSRRLAAAAPLAQVAEATR
jgi:GT2 family glycosyltransferase